MKQIVYTLTFTLLTLTKGFGQDGSNIHYVKIANIDRSFVGRFVHLDFYNKSFHGKPIDTVVISINNIPIKFIEHRKDNGYNNWFSEQYLVSVNKFDGLKLRIVKSKIDSVTTDSILVTNYLEYYDRKNKLITEKSKQQKNWFKKEIIKEILINQTSYSSKPNILITDTLIITGKYTGKDIYVQNPMTVIGTDTTWTAQKVFVNDNLVLSEKQLQKNSFVIPLTKLNLYMQDPVTLKIIQTNTNRVKILNP